MPCRAGALTFTIEWLGVDWRHGPGEGHVRGVPASADADGCVR